MGALRQRIILISYIFHPMRSVASVRLSKFAKFMALKNLCVHVFTTVNARFTLQSDYLRDTDMKNIHIHALPTLDPLTWEGIFKRTKKYFSFPRQKNSPKEFSQSLEKTTRPSYARKLLKSLLRTFPLNLFLDKGGLLYVFCGIREGHALVKKSPSHVYIFSSCIPISNHYIAFILKKIYKTKIVWIADFRDAFVEKMPSALKAINLFFLKKMLTSCHEVTCVSQGVKELIYPYHSNIHVLSNGFDPDDFPSPQSPTDQETSLPPSYASKFSFSLTGRIYKEQGNPCILLQTLRDLLNHQKIDGQHLQINYAGPSSSLMRRYLHDYQLLDYFQDYGHVDRSHALRLQGNSFFLILLTLSTSKDKGIITGKFYEYLMARRPILYLITGSPEPEISHLARTIQFGLVAASQENAVNKKVENYILLGYNAFLRHESFSDLRWEQCLKLFHYKNVTDSLLQKFLNHSPCRQDPDRNKT